MSDVRKVATVLPRELPEIRHDLVNGYTRYARRKLTEGVPGELVATLQAVDLVAEMGSAAMFYITRDFGDLLRQARDTMPLHPVQPADLPTPQGIALFDSSHVRTLDGEAYIEPAGFLWTTYMGNLYAGELICEKGLALGNPDADAPADFPRYFPMVDMSRFGFTATSGNLLDEGTFAQGAYLTALAFWNLLRQQHLTETDETAPPRPERRRLAKQGVTRFDPVRVIRLRPRRATSTDSSGPERDYRHRWVVRGHWRQQWYPSLQDRRPVWISPHIKGPEGAPLLGGEKVYVADAVTAGASVGGDS